jgi:type VI protein secretion system component VasK
MTWTSVEIIMEIVLFSTFFSVFIIYFIIIKKRNQVLEEELKNGKSDSVKKEMEKKLKHIDAQFEDVCKTRKTLND